MSRSRQSSWSSAPLACQRCCQLAPGKVCQPAQHGQHPQPAGLLAQRVAQRERRGSTPGPAPPPGSASVAGHDDATGRGGNAASSAAPVGLTATARHGTWHGARRLAGGVAGRRAESPASSSAGGHDVVLAEQDLQALRPVSRRRRRGRVAVALPGVEGEHPGDHVLGHRVQVALRGR